MHVSVDIYCVSIYVLLCHNGRGSHCWELSKLLSAIVIPLYFFSAPGNLFGDTVHFSNFFKFFQAARFNLDSSLWHALKPIHVAVC